MMKFALIAGLVVLHTALCVSGQEVEDNECGCQQELAAVKADMQRQVDELHSQLHYWQNTTINILKEHIFSSNSGTTTECKVGADSVLESRALDNITQSNKEVIDTLDNLQERLDNQLGMMEDGIEVMNDQMAVRLEVIDDRLETLGDIVEQQQIAGQCSNAMTGSFHNPAQNCSHIALLHPNATSGDYWLQRATGYAVKVYCDMERVCGCDERRGEGGGWMRVADIDMTRHKENCPSGFRRITSSDKVMCGGQGSRCIGTMFSTHGIEYSRVCGRIIGYQFGRPNAFWAYNDHTLSIEREFLDGIVLTYGAPRCHIWSFVGGKSQYETGKYACPCNIGFIGTVPPYVNNDYFCDSGHRYSNEPPLIHFINDPLWDGEGCVEGNGCCQLNSPPWFCKDLPQSTTEDIELRLCLDERTSNEDTPFEVVEVYVE